MQTNITTTAEHPPCALTPEQRVHAREIMTYCDNIRINEAAARYAAVRTMPADTLIRLRKQADSRVAFDALVDASDEMQKLY